MGLVQRGVVHSGASNDTPWRPGTRAESSPWLAGGRVGVTNAAAAPSTVWPMSRNPILTDKAFSPDAFGGTTTVVDFCTPARGQRLGGLLREVALGLGGHDESLDGQGAAGHGVRPGNLMQQTLDALMLGQVLLLHGGAFVMGMGDLIMPSILVVSSHVFVDAPPAIWVLSAPTLGAMIGSLAGLAVLLYFVNRGNPQAGLPPLNGGAIAGFLIGAALAGSFGWLSL